MRRLEPGADAAHEDVAQTAAHAQDDIEAGGFERATHAFAVELHERDELADRAVDGQLATKGEVRREVVESGDLAAEGFGQIDCRLPDPARNVEHCRAAG